MSTSTGSTSLNPDLDWSQLKETILMLNLSIAQIDQSMNEGNSSVDTLASSFTALAANLSEIQSAAEQMNDNNYEEIKMNIEGSTTTALDKIQSAIVAFQFYDKLTQRLDHVSHSLSSLTTLISNPASLYSPPEWQTLQKAIRSKYTMEEERRMFDKVISGVPIEKALAEFKEEMLTKNESANDDIELF